MKTTKIMKFFYTILIPVFLLGFFSTSFAQDKAEKKEVKIKMIKEENGKKVVIDTTFDVSNLESLKDIPELQEFLEANNMEDLDINIIDIDDLSDMDVEVIESEKDGEVVTKTIMIKSSNDGDIEMDKHYNVIVHSNDSSSHGNVVKIKVDGDSEAYFISDDEDIQKMNIDVDGEKHMVIVKKGSDGEETNVMVTGGDFSFYSDEDGESIRIEEGEDGKKKVLIENEDGSIKEILLDDEKGAYMIDEEGNLTKIDEGAVWVDDAGETITLDVEMDDSEKTIIIKENGTTIDIKDLDGDNNVWIYSSDDEMDSGEEMEVFIEVIEKKDGDNTITIKKKVILKTVCEKDLENLKNSDVNLKPGVDNKLELDKLVFSPNPSDGKFTLKFNTPEAGKTLISIYDVTGKQVYKENIKNFDGVYNSDIDISSEGKGTYFLKIQQGDKFSTRKIILE